MKRNILLYVGVTVFLFLNIIYYSLGSVSLRYVDSELTLNSTNDKIKEEIYEYVKMFDKNVLESLQVYDNDPYELKNEQILDIAVKYIISNQGKFNEKIEYFKDKYCYEKDGTIYYSKGYVDKGTFENVIFNFFGEKNLDIENSIYFDKARNLVALLLIYGDMPTYKRDEILEFEEIDYYSYDLTIKYFISDNISFKITYRVERNMFDEYGKYKLLGIKIN